MRLNATSLLLTCLATAGAIWLIDAPSAPTYEEQLTGVAVRQSFGNSATQIAAEPLEVQSLLLDYSENESLLLRARLALLRYPHMARRILPVYGGEPEFQEALLTYGEAVLLPIAYFMDHDLASLEMRRALGEHVEEAKLVYARLMGSPQDFSPPAMTPGSRLTAEERGWYAVQFLLDDGYDFIGQFTVGPDGKADRVQSERITEGLTDFFFGGVQGLETRWRRDAEVEGPDLGWAALDVAIIASSVKLFKTANAGRAVAPADAGITAARSGAFSGRTARLSSRVLARGGRFGIAAARYGAIPMAVYLMFRYPSLINATLAELGGWFGVEPLVVQFVFWFVAISVILRFALFLLGPLSWVLRSLGGITGALAGWTRSTRTDQRFDARVF
jgi:hypothetical protein